MTILPTRSTFLALTMCAAAGLALTASPSGIADAADQGPQVGLESPQFEGTDSNGNAVDLSAFRGQKVILEWTNHDCPYVRKHYDDSERNMQVMQEQAAEQGAVWLTVISSAPGKQGHVSGEEAKGLSESRGAAPTAVVLDEDGTIGRLYEAKTTPHMYIIDEAGVLQYMGAIDSKRSSNPVDIPAATNHVTQALGELAAGQAVSVPVTQPYGCSVKYSG